MRTPQGVRILIICSERAENSTTARQIFGIASGDKTDMDTVLRKFQACPNESRTIYQQMGTPLRQLLSNLCYLERESKDNKTIKIADFVITKEIAMEYMKKRYPGYHMRPSRWKDIKFSVHI